MKYVFGKRELMIPAIREEGCYLMTNGLGGFSSLNLAGACSRNDHAALMSCPKQEAPNNRYQMIHWLEEILFLGEEKRSLSGQRFGDGSGGEGCAGLILFSYEDYPCWTYLTSGVEITKTLVLQPGENTLGAAYEIRNRSQKAAALKVTPWMQFVPKGQQLCREQAFLLKEDPETPGRVCTGAVFSEGKGLYYSTDGRVETYPTRLTPALFYELDARDGRRAQGICAVNHSVWFRVEPGETLTGTLVYSADGPVETDFTRIREALTDRRNRLTAQAGLKDETAGALVKAADQFVSYRASTGQQTILAGYPFFEDWGRDTMIALTGCCLSTGQYRQAKSILRTFMKYCRKGLMPNLFPEGTREPKYNTADAALLFILAVYGYYRRTGDGEFVSECVPVMEDIVQWYRQGTDFHIRMEEDGLISAGEGFDQVTWMDVRVGDILPTPRHGKPVEINAYWYNALCIMEELQGSLKERNSWKSRDYGSLAALVKQSFQEKFWNRDEGCLKDVLSGTEADCQIRCNQIWAVAQPFSVLTKEQERQVVETVFRKLYTPLGLRTLDPADSQFRPAYGGELLQRDLAYHQGTVWAYPLGAYYLAWLKVNGGDEGAAAQLRRQLQGTAQALREGCVGQLPEIYDGLDPGASRGCFAQAWSVGELLRVYEALERMETGREWYL